jgi:hypothetical protein
MKPFIVAGGNVPAYIGEAFGTPKKFKWIDNGRLLYDTLLPKSFEDEFNKSDVFVTYAVWGSEQRKNEFPFNVIKDTEISGWHKSAAFMDHLNSLLIPMAKEQGKKIIVTESQTISRCNKSVPPKNYFRMGRDSWLWGEGKWCDAFDTLPKYLSDTNFSNHEWLFKTDGSIYILTGYEKDPTSSKHPQEFVADTVKEIRSFTKRKIVIRKHPQSEINLTTLLESFENITVQPHNITLNDSIKDMYCAVIDNSTSVFELVEKGIPVFCSNLNFGALLGNVNVKNIENPYLLGKNDVMLWAKKMAATEFDRVALDKKFFKKRLFELLEK